MAKKLRFFFSYAHEDLTLRDELEKHLAGLRLQGAIESWSDGSIEPGTVWDDAIAAELERADIILLLVSPDFLSSSYATGVELRRALERHRSGLTVVVPVILRPVDWRGLPFGRLQALPTEGKPVTEWRTLDEGFLDVAQGIRRVVDRLRSGERPSPDLDVTILRQEVVPSKQDRVLDAAIASRVPLGKPTDLVAMVREVVSSGLRGLLEKQDWEFSAVPEDVRSKPFRLAFPFDELGNPTSAHIKVRVDAPDFDPREQTKTIEVPVRGDSEVCTFLLTPLFSGQLVINLEVYAGEDLHASRIFRVIAEESDRAVVAGRVLVSVPLTTVVRDIHEAPTGKANQWSRTVAATSPASSLPKEATDEHDFTVATSARGIDETTGRHEIAPATSNRKVSGRFPFSAAAVLFVMVSAGSIYYLTLSPGGKVTPLDETAVAVQMAHEAVPAAILEPAKVLAPANVAPHDGTWQEAYTAGVTALQAGKLDVATRRFETARGVAATEDRPLAGLAMTHLAAADASIGAEKTQQLAAALENVGAAISLDPNSATNYLLQGKILERSGRSQEAIASLKKATDLNPGLASAWYLHGVILHDEKRSDEATAALRKAVELDPENHDARLLLAASLAKEHPAEAKREADTLVRNNVVSGVKLKAAKSLSAAVARR